MGDSAHIDRIFRALSGRRSMGEGVAAPHSDVLESWRRCVDQYRLEPQGFAPPPVFTRNELQDFRDPLDALLHIARYEVDRLFARLRNQDYLILLTDRSGVVLDFRCDAALYSESKQFNLYPGAHWTEAGQGTNGVGTCVRTGKPVAVVMGDHFSTMLRGLTCTVAPILGTDGRLLAALNVTTPRRTDRSTQDLVLQVIGNSARRIEHALFRRELLDTHLLVNLSENSGRTDLAAETIVAIDDDDRITAVGGLEPGALALPEREDLLGAKAQDVLQIPVKSLRLAGKRGGVVDLPGLGRQGLFARFPPAVQRARTMQNGPLRTKKARHHAPDLDQLAGQDPTMVENVRLARRVLDKDLPILLYGPTGSGKGAFARALHQASERSGHPFVAVNCAAIPENLIEGELFGHRPGAFTGAAPRGAKGRILEANRGTLFLDEIGDMQPALQTRLLRVLSDGELTPLGGGQTETVDIAVISATHQDLLRMVEQGAFREDLYYRLGGAAFRIPALCERADRAALVARVLDLEADALGLAPTARPHPAADLLEFLGTYPWPGNVRELRTALRYALSVCDADRLTLDHLPPQLRSGGGARSKAKGSRHLAIELALLNANWNVTAAARALGVSRSTLHRRMREHGITRGVGKGGGH